MEQDKSGGDDIQGLADSIEFGGTPGDLKKKLLNRGFRIIIRKNLPMPLFSMSLHSLTVAEKV